jgi:hypothetical protein
VADSEGRYFPAPGSERLAVQATLDLVALAENKPSKVVTDSQVRFVMEFRRPERLDKLRPEPREIRPWAEENKQRIRDYVARHGWAVWPPSKGGAE